MLHFPPAQSRIEFLPFAVFVAVFLPIVFLSHANHALAQEAEADRLSGPIKIVSLLWSISPEKSAVTLSETIAKAIERDQLKSLRKALATIDEKTKAVVEGELTDARWAPALAVQMVIGNENIHRSALRDAMPNLNGKDAELLLTVWFNVDAESAFEFLGGLVKSPEPSDSKVVPAAEQESSTSRAIAAAFEVNRTKTTTVLLQAWKRLPKNVAARSIEPMTAAPETMLQVVSAVQAGEVSKDLFNTNQLRKWLRSGNEEISAAIESVWGQIREDENATRAAVVADTLKLLLSGKQGSVARGETVFTRVCSQCHQLHGKGYEVGPNITGNGRGNIQQLVSNVMDPSLVIGEAFQARTILTVDGEVVTGLLAGESDRYLTIKLQGGKSVELDKDEDIELLKISEKSLMPEGIEEQINEQETLDLFAFLSLLKPLSSEENDLIPGTPETLVGP